MRWADIEAMHRMPYEELRQMPGFPQPRGSNRLRLWFKLHPTLALLLLLLAFMFTVGMWAIPWLIYHWLADRGNSDHVWHIQCWWYACQQEAELQEMVVS